MAEQRIKFEIKDVANLILSLLPEYYCTEEVNSENESVYKIVDYIIRRGESSTKGNNFVMTIYKDRIEIFMFPTLNLKIKIKDESEFQEIISLYLDFKTRVEKYLYKLLQNKITVTGSHKNPWEKFAMPDDLPDFENANFNFRVDAVVAPEPDLMENVARDARIDRHGNRIGIVEVEDRIPV